MNYELYHHGVKGMKWGIRRTKEVLQKSSEGVNEASRLAKNLGKGGSKKAKKATKRLSDDELRRRVSRLNMEKQYNSLTGNDRKRGAEIASNVLATIGSVTAIGASIASIALAIKTIDD